MWEGKRQKGRNQPEGVETGGDILPQEFLRLRDSNQYFLDVLRRKMHFFLFLLHIPFGFETLTLGRVKCWLVVSVPDCAAMVPPSRSSIESPWGEGGPT